MFVKHSKKPAGLIVFFTLLTGLIFLFQWDWFKPALQGYLVQKSHRIVTIGELDVDFSGLLNPTIKFKDLYIQNASWSNEDPLIVAKEISFTLNGLQLLMNKKGKSVDISMKDAKVNLESLSNGLRNWRITDPNYRGVGKYTLLSLNVQRSTIRFNSRDANLDVTGSVSPNSNPAELPCKIQFMGKYGEFPFNGLAYTPTLVTFQNTKKTFPINAYVKEGINKFEINGQIGDAYRNAIIDADIKLSGNLLSLFNFFKHQELLGDDFINLAMHVNKQSNTYQLERLEGDIYATDFWGQLTYIDDMRKPQLTGNLSIDALNLHNFRGFNNKLKFFNTNHSERLQPTTAFIASPQDKVKEVIFKDYFKKSQINLGVQIKKIADIPAFALSNLNMHINVLNGELILDPLNAYLNGGNLKAKGSLKFDLGIPTLDTEMTIHNLQIGTLLRSSNLYRKVSAPLEVRLNLSAAGNSISDMTNNIFGKVGFYLAAGKISNKLDATLGMDIGKLF